LGGLRFVAVDFWLKFLIVEGYTVELSAEEVPRFFAFSASKYTAMWLRSF